MTLAGKVALVTGAGRGIGRVIAIALARQGATVSILARGDQELTETAREVEAIGGRYVKCAVDIADSEAVASAIEKVHTSFGRIDILVNNAGMQAPIGPVVTNDPAEWLRCVTVNLFGTFICTRHVLPIMIRQRSGKIINLSGGGATSPRPNFSAYAASKAAVVRFTETVAAEVAGSNVQVNCIAPGAVNTRMLDEVLASGDLAGEEAGHARRRKHTGGVPPEVAADLVCFLASNDSGELSGKLISALHDGWQHWTREDIGRLTNEAWLTLRRIDENTLAPLLAQRVGNKH